MAGKAMELLAKLEDRHRRTGELLMDLRAVLEDDPTPGQEAKRVLDYFVKRWELKYPGKKMVVNGAKDMAILKRFLRQLPADDLAARVARYFQLSDRFVVDAKYSIPVFAARINELIEPRRVQSPFVLGCEHQPPCQDEVDHTRRLVDEERSV